MFIPLDCETEGLNTKAQCAYTVILKENNILDLVLALIKMNSWKHIRLWKCNQRDFTESNKSKSSKPKQSCFNNESSVSCQAECVTSPFTIAEFTECRNHNNHIIVSS